MPLAHAILCNHLYCLFSYFPQCSNAPRHLCLLQSHPSSCLGTLRPVTKLLHPAPLGKFDCVTNFLDSTPCHTCPVQAQGCSNTKFEGSGGSTDGHKSIPWHNDAYRCKAAESCTFLDIAVILPPQRQRELTGWSIDFSYNNLGMLVSRPSKTQYFPLVSNFVWFYFKNGISSYQKEHQHHIARLW